MKTTEQLTPEGRRWLREQINKAVRSRNRRETRIKIELVKRERKSNEPKYCSVRSCLHRVKVGYTVCDFHIR